MSEAGLLVLLSKYSHAAALARNVDRARLFPVLRRLECDGYVIRHCDVYRLTGRGRRALAFQRALDRTVARALS
jgi:hypothetical protein